jgi:class 3 adenylate cyclase
MHCAKCGADNRETARFCDGCGAPIPRQCPSCGALSRVVAKFCDACGTPLLETPAEFRVSRESTAPEAIDGERKTVTALFADLKGSIELMESLDPEEGRAMIDPAL